MTAAAIAGITKLVWRATTAVSAVGIGSATGIGKGLSKVAAREIAENAAPKLIEKIVKEGVDEPYFQSIYRTVSNFLNKNLFKAVKDFKNSKLFTHIGNAVEKGGDWSKVTEAISDMGLHGGGILALGAIGSVTGLIAGLSLFRNGWANSDEISRGHVPDYCDSMAVWGTKWASGAMLAAGVPLAWVVPPIGLSMLALGSVGAVGSEAVRQIGYRTNMLNSPETAPLGFRSIAQAFTGRKITV